MPSHRRRLPVLVAAFLAILASPAPADPCDGDLDGSGSIDGADVGALLAAFGTAGGSADLDGNGTVDGADLGLLLGAWGADCPGEPRATELVGKPLAAPPWFQFALAFNEGDPIWVQLDPLAHPALIGVETTLYVVAARSAAEWSSDPALVDVRAGGAQAVVFPGGAYADNSVPIDAGSLSGDGGVDVGVGYDVVIDVDGSGTLTGGDLVDGLGDEPGFAVVEDLTQPGPLAVSTSSYSVSGTPAGFTSQRAYYPTDIGSMGQLPLVVVAHGNGHVYTWYDWLGTHLASHGYVVVSHANNTQPGVEAASTTTLQHTQAIIAQQATIAGGALGGHIDADRIVWIGHSRGGEGVVRAYDRIFDGAFTPTNFGLEDIVLVSSIAPTDFLGTNSANPHAVPYHLVYGAADGDVCGCPDNSVAQSFALYERAGGFRASTYLHGADHNDFNCCGVNDFQGPAGTQIGRPAAQAIAKVAYLCLIEHVLDGSAAARDILARHYEDLRPLGTLSTATVVNDLRPAPADGDIVIDDFQTQSATTTSSSGGVVTFSVSNLAEQRLDDTNTSFTWTTIDPFNGMTRARSSDLERGAVFDWQSPAFLAFEVPAGLGDVRGHEWLQFRAAQGTRHPRTTAELGNLTFLVTLVDGSGASRTLSLASYGIGIQEPYQRTGFGTGPGWQNEFELVRLRLVEFAVDGGVDLADIVSIRFDFGQPGTSSQGRLGFDDLRFSVR